MLRNRCTSRKMPYSDNERSVAELSRKRHSNIKSKRFVLLTAVFLLMAAFIGVQPASAYSIRCSANRSLYSTAGRTNLYLGYARMCIVQSSTIYAQGELHLASGVHWVDATGSAGVKRCGGSSYGVTRATSTYSVPLTMYWFSNNVSLRSGSFQAYGWIQGAGTYGGYSWYMTATSLYDSPCVFR